MERTWSRSLGFDTLTTPVPTGPLLKCGGGLYCTPPYKSRKVYLYGRSPYKSENVYLYGIMQYKSATGHVMRHNAIEFMLWLAGVRMDILQCRDSRWSGIWCDWTTTAAKGTGDVYNIAQRCKPERTRCIVRRGLRWAVDLEGITRQFTWAAIARFQWHMLLWSWTN